MPRSLARGRERKVLVKDTNMEGAGREEKR